MAGIHHSNKRVSTLGVACLALIALSLTGCAHDRHTGAVIGAAVGAGIGYVIGNEVEKGHHHHKKKRHGGYGHYEHRPHQRVVRRGPYCD